MQESGNASVDPVRYLDCSADHLVRNLKILRLETHDQNVLNSDLESSSRIQAEGFTTKPDSMMPLAWHYHYAP